MTETKIKIELYTTPLCPFCKQFKQLLEKTLPEFDNKFKLVEKSASTPLGYLKTMRLGIHSVPALVIHNTVVFRNVPSKEELITVLSKY